MNGLRATFIRSGSSGVTSFHSICGDAPDLERKSGSADTSDGVKLNQDAALAIGKGAATTELLNLPLTELERRCRHNGLSLVGGREMMVARLLYLEEAEKQRGYELDDELKSTNNQSSSTRYPSARKESGFEVDQGRVTGWNSYMEHETHSRGRGSVSLPPSDLPLLPEFNPSEAKNESILPASKWAREDDGSEDDQEKTKDLGLTYSSSGSDNNGDPVYNNTEIEINTDTSNSAHLNGVINEEQR